MCTAVALALDDLATTLADASDLDVETDTWRHSVIAAFVLCPMDAPLEHTLFEALIGMGGIDVSEPDHLGVAARVSAFLLGTGLLALTCDHQAPTPLCPLLQVPDPTEVQLGARVAAIGQFAVLTERRAAKAAWFTLQVSNLPA